MSSVRVTVSKIIDQEFFPTFVECEFIDTNEQTHRFRDKIVIFSCKSEILQQDLPFESIISCSIVSATTTDMNINTFAVDSVESTEGKTRFTIPTEIVQKD